MAKHKKRKLNAPMNGSKNNQRPLNSQKSMKATPSAKPGPTLPFDLEDRILLVGEGDFSFAKSVVEHHGCCCVTATCLDAKDKLFDKYKPQAEQHIRYLEDEGQTVHYSVDATKLDSNKALRNAAFFDRIFFNFPHVGGKSKDVNRQVRYNQELLVNFFAAAMSLLAPSGTIAVTLFEGEPYSLWNVCDLARHSGLVVQRSFNFQAEWYPGYGHSRTLGNIEGGGGWKGEDRAARTYIFQKKGAQGAVAASGNKKRKHKDDDESSDDTG